MYNVIFYIYPQLVVIVRLPELTAVCTEGYNSNRSSRHGINITLLKSNIH